MTSFSRFLSSTALSALLLLTPPALAQQSTAQPEADGQQAEPDEGMIDDYDPEGEEIIVTGTRLPGSVIGDIPPENILDSRDVRATGATSIEEVLEAIAPQIGSARGRGDERPVLLLNGQRISSFRELRNIPSEAIARVEVLPEEVALKYGYRADQRVVNFVLRQRFRSTVAELEGTSATEGGYVGGEAELTRLMINRSQRTSLNLTVEGNSPLTEAERDIDLRDPALPDERGDRTLIGSRRLVRATGTANRQLAGVSATLNTELEHDEGRSLLGLSDFALEPLVRGRSSDSVHAGIAVNGDRGSWRWSATGNGDVVRSTTRSDRADESFRDRSNSLRRSADVDFTANGPLFDLPAGDASATFKVAASAVRNESWRRSAIDSSESDLSRSRGVASANIDLPISRRNRDFDALGNLTFNANAEIEQLSDFGTLTTLGVGFNLSPMPRMSFIASMTREEGAPSIQQLGDAILETPGTQVFDFTRGETAEVVSVTGGNPDLLADKRTVMKIGGNWQPWPETDLRLRAEYVRTRIDDPVSSFPGPSAALETAFPDRFVRDSAGQLIRVDLRPVNYEQARRDTFRWGFDFSKPLQSRAPTREQIERLRATRQQQRPQSDGGSAESSQRPGHASEGGPPASPQRETRGADAADRQDADGGGGRGGGRFGGFGGRGGRDRGRLQFSLTHTVNLVDEVRIGPGLPVLNYLDGDAVGQSGGRPAHEIELRGGWFNNGIGARVSADWRSGTEVSTTSGEQLRYSPLATVNLRLFANLGEQIDLVAKHPWLRGSSVRLEVNNLFDNKPRIRDAFGDTPFSLQPDLLDPLGRSVSISFRKLFLPQRFRGGSRSGR